MDRVCFNFTSHFPLQILANPSHRFNKSSIYKNVTLVAWDPAPYTVNLNKVCFLYQIILLLTQTTKPGHQGVCSPLPHYYNSFYRTFDYFDTKVIVTDKKCVCTAKAVQRNVPLLCHSSSTT